MRRFHRVEGERRRRSPEVPRNLALDAVLRGILVHERGGAAEGTGAEARAPYVLSALKKIKDVLEVLACVLDEKGGGAARGLRFSGFEVGRLGELRGSEE